MAVYCRVDPASISALPGVTDSSVNVRGVCVPLALMISMPLIAGLSVTWPNSMSSTESLETAIVSTIPALRPTFSKMS